MASLRLCLLALGSRAYDPLIQCSTAGAAIVGGVAGEEAAQPGPGPVAGRAAGSYSILLAAT